MLRSQLLLKHKRLEEKTPVSKGADNDKSKKTKKPETVALQKRKQKKFSKKIETVKKQVESGNIKVAEKVSKKPKVAYTRGVVHISHIPHGFYEEQMKSYFSQFGKVTNVMVCRSTNTGRSRGFGFVEFDNAEVAKIAAETMDNYLMFKRRVVAQYVPPENVKRYLFYRKVSEKDPPKKKSRKLANDKKNAVISDEQYINRSKNRLTKLQIKLQKFKDLGINYSVVPVDVPESLKSMIQVEKSKGKRDKVNNKTEKESNSGKMQPSKKVKTIIKKKVKTNMVKSDLIRLASKELLKDKDHIIVTRSALLKQKVKK